MIGMAKSPKFNMTVTKTKISIRHKCNQTSHDNLNLFGSSMCMPCKHGSTLWCPLMTYLVTYYTLNENFCSILYCNGFIFHLLVLIGQSDFADIQCLLIPI